VEIGAPAVEPLIDALKDRDVRSSVARALGEIGDARAAEPLISAARAARKDRHSDEARFDTRVALEKIGTPAVEPLIAALNDIDDSVRLDAVLVLGKIGDPRAVEPLIVALNDKYRFVRSSAAEVLGKIGDPRAVEPLIAVFRDADDSHVGKEAAIALGQIGDPRAVEPLAVALEDRKSTIRYAACSALGKVGDVRAVKPLVAVLKDTDERMLKAASGALVKIGALAVEPLIDALKNPGVRSEAIRALEDIGWQPEQNEAGAIYWIAKQQWDMCVEIGTPAVEPLIDALRDRDRDVRKRAAEALDKLGWRPEQNEAGATYWVVKQQLDKCTEIGAPAVEPLIDALKDPDVRSEAICALEDIGWQLEQNEAGATYLIAKQQWDRCVEIGAPAVEPLIDALGDTSEYVRKSAAQALERIGDRRAAESLIATLKDSSYDVHLAAVEALRRLRRFPGHFGHEYSAHLSQLDPHPMYGDYPGGPRHALYCLTCRAYVCTTCGSRVMKSDSKDYLGTGNWCGKCAPSW
jgi:HEAT repeat protein